MSMRLHLPGPLLPLMLLLAGCAHSSPPRNPPARGDGAASQLRSGAFVLIPDRTRIVDKVLADRCDLDPRTIYLLEGGWRAVPPRPVLRDERALDATLSPRGDLIAYGTGDEVLVVNLDGEIVSVWVGAHAHRWAIRDDRLALLYPGRSGAPADSFVIWDPRLGVSDTYLLPADDIGWGPGDSLFVRNGDDVASVDLRTGSVRGSRHVGVDVSNDGLLSLQRGREIAWWLFLDEGPMHLTPLTGPMLGDVRMTQGGPAFWIRTPGDHHLLCISHCGDWLVENGKRQWGCHTGIVDVLTREVVARAPGYLLGPSADGRGAWIYDGWDVFPLRLTPDQEGRSRRSVNLRITTRHWNPMRLEEPRSYVRTVREGDLIPIASERWSDLDNALRLVRVGEGRATLTLPLGWVLNPRVRHGPAPELFEVTDEPVQLQTGSGEKEGTTVTVSVAP